MFFLLLLSTLAQTPPAALEGAGKRESSFRERLNFQNHCIHVFMLRSSRTCHRICKLFRILHPFEHPLSAGAAVAPADWLTDWLVWRACVTSTSRLPSQPGWREIGEREREKRERKRERVQLVECRSFFHRRKNEPTLEEWAPTTFPLLEFETRGCKRRGCSGFLHFQVKTDIWILSTPGGRRNSPNRKEWFKQHFVL
jgi:hypothetical protein